MMSSSDEEELVKEKGDGDGCTKSMSRGNTWASAFFTRFLYSGWPVSYKNTYSRTFSINF